MALPLVESRPVYRVKSRTRNKRYRSGLNTNQRVDAATLASSLQLQEQHRDFVYSFIALGMKFGLLLIGSLSLIKLGIASYQRVDRHSELSSALQMESVKLIKLQKRFDTLFTIGGDRRLMDEQDQWIAPNRVRVIWR